MEQEVFRHLLPSLIKLSKRSSGDDVNILQSPLQLPTNSSKGSSEPDYGVSEQASSVVSTQGISVASILLSFPRQLASSAGMCKRRVLLEFR